MGLEILLLSTVNKEDVVAGRNINGYVEEIAERYNLAYQVWPLRDYGAREKYRASCAATTG